LRSRRKNNPRIARPTSAAAAPTPIPALTPVESPDDGFDEPPKFDVDVDGIADEDDVALLDSIA
jgi:hypothetical protein